MCGEHIQVLLIVHVCLLAAVTAILKFLFFRGERKCTRDINNNIVVGYNLSALPGGKYFIELEVNVNKISSFLAQKNIQKKLFIKRKF